VANIKEKVNTLPPEIKAKVSPVVMQKVFTNPLTARLKPIEQALIMHESGGRKDAKSPTGVIGLAQLTKDAAKDMKVDRNDPAQNVEGGIRYFNRELNKYNAIYKGATENNERLALMAYNGGPGAISEAIKLAIEKAGNSDADTVVDYLRYMERIGRFPKDLSPAKINEIEAYPDKVLAYKAAIERVTNVA
jgi:membrane-bound lytic murein transglycosylase MltF